jgi:hypothetical protein
MKKQLLLIIALLATGGLAYGVSFDYSKTKFNVPTAGLAPGTEFTITNIPGLLPKGEINPQYLLSGGQVWAEKVRSEYPYGGGRTPLPGFSIFKVKAPAAAAAATAAPIGFVSPLLAGKQVVTPGAIPSVAKAVTGLRPQKGGIIPGVTPVTVPGAAKIGFEMPQISVPKRPIGQKAVVTPPIPVLPLEAAYKAVEEQILPQKGVPGAIWKGAPKVAPTKLVIEEIPIPGIPQRAVPIKSGAGFLPGYTAPKEHVVKYVDVGYPVKQVAGIIPAPSRIAAPGPIIAPEQIMPQPQKVAFSKLQDAAEKARQAIEKLKGIDFFAMAVSTANVAEVQKLLATASIDDIDHQMSLLALDIEVERNMDKKARYQQIEKILQNELKERGADLFGKAVAQHDVERVKQLLSGATKEEIRLKINNVALYLTREPNVVERRKLETILDLLEKAYENR